MTKKNALRVPVLILAAMMASVPAGPSLAGPEIADDGAPTRVPLLLAQKSDDGALSKDALFGDDELAAPKSKSGGTGGESKRSGAGVKGYVQAEFARTVADPAHWSKLRLRADLSATGRISERVKYKLGARLDADGAYDQSDLYPDEVRRTERFDAVLRENYLDINAGGLDFRVGRQHVVWGEMVGLYFADVVSARDLREFILPDFETQRIPQWAARAEYFLGDLHAELLWIPVPSFDRIGKPGGEFFPNQPPLPGLTTVYRSEITPDRNSSNTNYGARLSGLFGGWDLSAFAYRSMDVAPTFSRTVDIPNSSVIYQATHERISQFGGTLSKDLGSIVLKSEAVKTRGRKFTVLDPLDADGLAPSDTVDWALGFDFTPVGDLRVNLQGFQRVYSDHNDTMLTKERESGYTVYVTNKFSDRFEAQLLWIASLDRTDRLMRPKLIWNVARNWRVQAGADVFKGPATGLFGQYDSRDRVYTEVRYSY